LKSMLPDADVTLREHRLSFRPDSTQPSRLLKKRLARRC
jgi:hypothetical protein